MKYIFSFTKINYGSVVIESDYEPTEDEVIDAIRGTATYHGDANYKGIHLVCIDRASSKNEQR
ncbi:hypothetical protein LJC01_00675 [Clostridiaceae bacterium OttesenSCG-928-D20]|nr:hypothetical protein [Clostridiaceae bacterium OttesenSCG-928-D20]